MWCPRTSSNKLKQAPFAVGCEISAFKPVEVEASVASNVGVLEYGNRGGAGEGVAALAELL